MMSEAKKLLSQLDEGVESDLYSLLRDPSLPKWLHKVLTTAATQPDHAHTAQWLRKLADALDGGAKGGQSPAPSQPAAQAAAAPVAAPSSLPNTTTPPVSGNGNLSAGDPDAAKGIRNLVAQPQTPEWVGKIVHLSKGTNAKQISTWLSWLAELAHDPNTTEQQFNGVLANPQVPTWVKEAAKIADESGHSTKETGDFLKMLAQLYGQVVPAAKTPAKPKVPAQNPALKQSLATKLGNAPSPEADALQGRYDPSLVSGLFGNVDHSPAMGNVRFDNE